MLRAFFCGAAPSRRDAAILPGQRTTARAAALPSIARFTDPRS
jgi:hypothetical protein